MGLNIEGEGVVEARPSEVVERVASALSREALICSAMTARGEEMTEVEYQTRLARAAITAMAQPTEPMIEAYCQAHQDLGFHAWANASYVLPRLITAALSPSGGRE